MKKNLTTDEYLKKLMSGEVSETCPVRRTLEILSGKWRTHVIYELCKKPSLRFGELKRMLPHITNTMLTSTLRDLEELGIVNRKQFNEIPPHVEYSLTDKGKGLLPVFTEIANWGEQYAGESRQEDKTRSPGSDKKKKTQNSGVGGEK